MMEHLRSADPLVFDSIVAEAKRQSEGSSSSPPRTSCRAP
jgi:hypothetical protein